MYESYMFLCGGFIIMYGIKSIYSYIQERKRRISLTSEQFVNLQIEFRDILNHDIENQNVINREYINNQCCIELKHEGEKEKCVICLSKIKKDQSS